MRRIIDYKDIRRLGETTIDSLIKNGVVVTATADLAEAMDDYYADYRVIDIHGFLDVIIKQWQSNIKDVKNYVVLRNVIENYIEKNDVNNTNATYLRRNAKDMWDAIKLLIEADVYPDDIEPRNSQPLKYFKGIWNDLEVENDLLMAFRSAFSFELSQKQKVIEKIEAGFGDLKKNIYLVGFYFITPIQDRIFDVLESAGYELTFLNCRNADYEYATEIWKETFREGYAAGGAKNVQTDIHMDNSFGDVLLGRQTDIPIKVIKHHTETDFAEMVKAAVDKGEPVYSPDSKRCETILKEYFPENYGQKHLLSFPVGQYIYFLHSMWDSFSNHLDLQYDFVFRCFASGWVSTDRENGRDHLYELKILGPYFKDCHSIEEWEKRISLLIEAKQSISGFDKNGAGKSRWHKLLGDPFNSIGVYTISTETLSVLKDLLGKMIKDAKFLFENGERVDLYEHFQRITTIIQSHFDKDEVITEETKIAKELISQLSDESTKGITCPMSGVRDAIVLLIGDSFNEYETQDEETAKKDRMVSPLAMVEAEILKKHGKKVHLVLSDEFSLPGKPKNLPWPLTMEMLDDLMIHDRPSTKRYVEDMRAVIENRPLSYRYLFFSFIGIAGKSEEQQLSIEWVCHKDKKEIEVSPYVKLLVVEKDKYIDVMRSAEDYEAIIADEPIKDNDRQLTRPDDSVPEEVLMDYLLCEKRYIYSYLLNLVPRFTSEFHYSFELSKLISALTIISGIDKNLIAEKMYELFPFLRHIELRQSVDFASTQGEPEPYEYDGIEFPAQRLLTHYLNNEVIREARRRESAFREQGQRTGQDTDDLCTYCPYSDICIDKHKKG